MAIFRGFAIYAAIIGLILISILLFQVNIPLPKNKPVSPPALNPYEDTIAASGIIEAVDRNTAIGVPQPGLVIAIYVDVWSRVKQGEALFQIDNRELTAQLLAQKANVKVAEANLNRLKDQLARLESVQDVRAISRDELNTRQNDVHVAEAQLDYAIAQLGQTQLLIERLTVRAPKNGIILQNNIRLGEYVSTNVSAMILGNIEHLQVRADIDEQNASSFTLNSEATAFPKNNTTLAIPLKFNYVEPYVIPKRSLTGASDERVDTRVLQVIYNFEYPKDFPIYVGQQVDVFIKKAKVHTQNEQTTSSQSTTNENEQKHASP